MAGTLTDALHDLDLPAIVRSNKDMERIRVALEANTQPEEALKIVDSLTRFVVERTGAQLTQEFAQALRDLTELQETVLNKYESSVKGSKVAPADLKSELQPALTKRSELFDKITRITSEEGQDMVDVDVDELLRGGDEGDRPSRDVPDRPRDDPEFMPEVPNLPAASRAAAAGVVRRIVTAETEEGLGQGLTELEHILRDAQMPEREIADTLEALEQLNAEQRALRAQRDTLATLERIRDLDDPVAMNRVLNERLDELTRRARELRRAGNSTRAEQLDRDAERLRRLAVGRTSLNDVDAFQAQVSRSKSLFQVMQAGGGDTLRRLWLQYWSRGRVPKSSFERYVEILSHHYRGNLGEFEVAFRLGDRHILLKAPDALVTLPGTDLIAIPRGGGDILQIDNKAFSAAEVDQVNALTRNLPRNLDTDLDAFAKLAGDSSLPAEFQTAVSRLTKARNEIQAKFGKLTRTQLEDPMVQTEIGNILRSNGIRRVVSNAGGEVTGLSSELQSIGIELLDLNL